MRASCAAFGRASRARRTFSRTVSQGIRRGSWNTMPTSGVGPDTSRLWRATRPLLGRSRPETMRSRVDLPQPEVPTRETISCWPTEDRQSGVYGKHETVRVDLGGRRIFENKQK